MKLFVKICFVLLTCSSLFAQSRKELQKRKMQLLEEIELSNSVLDQTLNAKNVSVHQLKALKQKIAIRSQLIRTIQKEVGYIKEEIELSTRQQELLENDLDSLKSTYAVLVQQAYKSSRHFNRLLFLFSSNDFQQAYKRLFYIRQISKYRMHQAAEIEEKSLDLEKSIVVLKNQKVIKQNLISDKRLENQLLNQEQAQESASLATLAEKAKDLKKDLKIKRSKRKKIQKEIERIIAEELRKVNSSGSNKAFASTPEAIALSKSFTSNKGKLPWPVAKGLVISMFGKQKHPVLSGVVIENNGIEIATESHSTCRAVFNGKVSSVLSMPNGIKVVMVRHGEYISVYSNLSEVYVEKGEELSTKSPIGIVLTSQQDGSTVVDFQLWKASTKLNPQKWLMRK
jgi:septal ring factor EnvC (AmiA/AmiB activator)